MRILLLLTACLWAAAPNSFAQDEGPWIPSQTTSWQWQLTVPVDLSVEAEVYDIDLFTNDASVVQELHNRGRRVICYVSVGTYERFRPDSDAFPDEIKGNRLEDFRNERWLDIRRLDVLGPIMEARLDLCRDRGFDAVEPDNVDAYVNDSGFGLTYADQLAYNRFIAKAAHDRGLSVGLKNDLDQIADLVDDFDWALNEQCYQYQECESMQPFLDAGKAVFHVEYEIEAWEFCPAANAMPFNSLLKSFDLDATGVACRPPAGVATVWSVRNAASGVDQPLAPGEIVSLYGADLGPAELVAAEPSENGRFPSELAGVQVLIGGIPARFLYARSDQTSVVVPYGIAPGQPVEVVVVQDGKSANGFPLLTSVAAPGVFTANSSGIGPAAALNQDYSLNAPGSPARRGDIVMIYATGEGQTNPPGEDGLPANSSLPAPALPVRVFIGGMEADILYAGGAPGMVAGLMQVNARIPLIAPTGSAVPVVVQVGPRQSQAGVTLSIEE